MSIEVKICGITNLEDAQAAIEFGADYLGFIFYEKSPRYVALEDAQFILDRLTSRARGVGVFVNETRARVIDVVREAGLYSVQLHGDESPDDFRDMPVTMWRAVRGVMEDDAWLESWSAERYVVDSSVRGMYGGTGVLSDWTAAARLAGKARVMLSGGLEPGNVADAIEVVKPFGVDVSSGVESCPGRKDHTKMKEFIERAKGA